MGQRRRRQRRTPSAGKRGSATRRDDRVFIWLVAVLIGAASVWMAVMWLVQHWWFWVALVALIAVALAFAWKWVSNRSTSDT